MRRIALIFCLLTTVSARAVIVSGGDGTSNTTNDGSVMGWDYVGSIGGASGVYLGNYGGSSWVLTAGHVGAGTFTLNGVSYSSVLDSAVTLTNSDGTPVDLVLFRIDGSPGLTNLTLASSAPRRNSTVTMIGNGIGREADATVAIGGSAYTGYYWSTPYAKRWGRNTVAGSTTITYQNSTVTTAAFYTQFSVLAGSAQATSGDSGGGVFASDGSLVGIMIAVGPLSGQPDNSSVYGENTYIASVAAYRSQILGIVSATPVPEPAALALILFGGTVMVLRRRA